MTVHRCLNGSAPPYLSEYCILVSSADTRRRLCSANRHLLAIPRFRLNTYGRRAFSVAGPIAWNSLPGGFYPRDLTSSTDCFKAFTVFICQQSHLLLFGIPSPTHSFIPGLNLPFLQILTIAAFPFSSGFTTWIPQTVYCYFLASLFSTFSFSVLTLFSCRFRAADQADSCRLSSAR